MRIFLAKSERRCTNVQQSKLFFKALENTIEILENYGFKIDYVDVTNSVTIKAGVEGRFDVNFGTENSLDEGE